MLMQMQICFCPFPFTVAFSPLSSETRPVTITSSDMSFNTACLSVLCCTVMLDNTAVMLVPLIDVTFTAH